MREPVRIADVGTGSGAVAIAAAVELRKRRVPVADVVTHPRDRPVARRARPRPRERRRRTPWPTPMTLRRGRPAAARPARRRAASTSSLANLPYVRSDAIAGLPIAASFEPRSALDGGPDGLDVIRALLARLPDALADDGVALLEIGGDQGIDAPAAVAAVLPGWTGSVETDLAGLAAGPAGPPVSPTLVRDPAAPEPAATAPEPLPPRPEPTFPIGLIALDLDGTLVGDDLVLGERTTAAIRAAIRRGVSVSIVTGRMTTSALRFARQLSTHRPDRRLPGRDHPGRAAGRRRATRPAPGPPAAGRRRRPGRRSPGRGRSGSSPTSTTSSGS